MWPFHLCLQNKPSKVIDTYPNRSCSLLLLPNCVIIAKAIGNINMVVAVLLIQPLRIAAMTINAPIIPWICAKNF